uniref:RING-type E3 ubiquitin transferase n=1 Tax=Xenopus tropicalis TaxID=8364 RepID=A0A1B8XSJ5_XENTR
MEEEHRTSIENNSVPPECGTNDEHLLEEALDSECPICLGTFDDVSYIEPCKHRFCFLCIETWIQVNGSCPMCRQHIRNVIMCEPDGRNGNVPLTVNMANDEVPLPDVAGNPAVGEILNSVPEAPLPEVGDGPAINLALLEEGLARDSTTETNENRRWRFKCTSTLIFGACSVITLIAVAVGFSVMHGF